MKLFNTNFKIYNFLAFLSSGLAVISCFLMGVDFIVDTIVTKLLFIISFLILFILVLFTDKYFKKCYQLKNNAKKEFTKENLNKG